MKSEKVTGVHIAMAIAVCVSLSWFFSSSESGGNSQPDSQARPLVPLTPKEVAEFDEHRRTIPMQPFVPIEPGTPADQNRTVKNMESLNSGLAVLISHHIPCASVSAFGGPDEKNLMIICNKFSATYNIFGIGSDPHIFGSDGHEIP